MHYKFYIFDVDGTLYSQPKMHNKMFGLILHEIFKNPGFLYDLYILQTFRDMREHLNEQIRGEIKVLQYTLPAKKIGISVDRVKSIVEKWIYQTPLSFIYDCRDKRLIQFINKLPEGSWGVFSDYPAQEKLAALGLCTDFILCTTDSEINAMKPKTEGLNALVKKAGVNVKECLMIGDRDDRDGEVARRIGMDYIVLPKSLDKRINIRIY